MQECDLASPIACAAGAAAVAAAGAGAVASAADAVAAAAAVQRIGRPKRDNSSVSGDFDPGPRARSLQCFLNAQVAVK